MIVGKSADYSISIIVLMHLLQSYLYEVHILAF